MKQLILYYCASALAAAAEGEKVYDLADLKEFSKEFRAANKRAGMYLRDASVFREVEQCDGVIILARNDDPAANVVREAYEEAEIAVKVVAELPDIQKKGSPEDEGDDEDDTDALSKLKAQAVELEVEFAPNIGYSTLKARVDAKLAEMDAKSEGGENAEG